MNVAGVKSTDSLHWVGVPTPGGNCLVSYSYDLGVVLAWQYNFAQIMNNTKIKADGEYKGLTVTELFTIKKFPMVESSGGAGRDLTSEIKHQLGLKNSDQFSYKILPKGNNLYEIYVSTDQSLLVNQAKNKAKLGTINVTGYIYQINADGSSKLIKTGTSQTIDTYTNTKGEEKMDVYGDQNTGKTPTNIGYKWD